MGTPVGPQTNPVDQRPVSWVPVDTTGHANHSAPSYYPAATSALPVQSTSKNPYVLESPVPVSGDTNTKVKICKMLDRAGKKLEDTSRKAGNLAGNLWHHLRTSPNIVDTAVGRLAQGTMVLAEGGHDRVFLLIFGGYQGEKLRKAFACYLSTSTGPVIGTLYLSTLRLAFCSDNPVCHYMPSGQQMWTYYKVVVQLDQLEEVNPSCNARNPAEKYIQVLTADKQQFWFMGFVSYEKALKSLREALLRSDVKSIQQA
ncbi:hypothetical protein HPP92_001742 [Vanilla planifolia]|uniref:GRAM domain-containing protein n=1 Tax=Vanilla planifolia TaxID=51239 RepID=A0A835VLP3_VANPL|nr:hypothetical protein HPP92_001742 [Vanilla planifolia]